MPGGTAIKIIAVTAHALEPEIQEILDAGCEQCIRKPFHDWEIFEALETHLGVHFLRHEVVDAAGPHREIAITAEELMEVSSEVLARLTAAFETLNVPFALEAIRNNDCGAAAPRMIALVHSFRFRQLLDVMGHASTLKRIQAQERT